MDGRSAGIIDKKYFLLRKMWQLEGWPLPLCYSIDNRENRQYDILYPLFIERVHRKHREVTVLSTRRADVEYRNETPHSPLCCPVRCEHGITVLVR
jgi:hypothetical protein